MRWLSKFQIPLYTFIWFLVLPFPFEPGWKLFGGYHIIANTYNSSVTRRLMFILVSLILGWLTYKALNRKNSSA